MHIAVYAITDLRSLRSVIKTLRKINQCPEVLEVPDEVENRIYDELQRHLAGSTWIKGTAVAYESKYGSFITVDGCHIVSSPPTLPSKR